MMMHDQNWHFVLLGTSRIRKQAAFLEEQIGDAVLNLTEQTSLEEALGVLRHASVVISEDSGLLHMGWASGVPTLALFGSTNHVWSQPVGRHVRSLHSGDLECGACMSPECRFGDVRCLTRYTPDFVYAQVMTITDGQTFDSRVA
jgi:ADP-heptose:LPS heptosyltransferase